MFESYYNAQILDPLQKSWKWREMTVSLILFQSFENKSFRKRVRQLLIESNEEIDLKGELVYCILRAGVCNHLLALPDGLTNSFLLKLKAGVEIVLKKFAIKALAKQSCPFLTCLFELVYVCIGKKMISLVRIPVFQKDQLKILILIIKMTQTTLHRGDTLALKLQQQRLTHLNCFFDIKEKVKCLTRQTLFLGIAIFDKFFQMRRSQEGQSCELQNNCELRVITCTWVAWKFIETDKIPIKKLLQKVQASITSQEVQQMEGEILEKIDYQIPSETAYATMTSEFHLTETDRRNGIVIAGKCIKFLMEALKFSSDFSLCAELGPRILQLYRQRCLQDVRIRSVYVKIQEKSSPKMINAIKAH